MGFRDVIGHEEIIKNLQNLISEDNITHSYLFEGKEGIGKLKVAREFSKTLLCEKKGNTYCDICNSCIKFNGGNHPDFKVIMGENRIIKKAEIDEIVDSVKHSPFESDKKIFIINNAHLMNKESMNGLLKTLEEPPKFLYMILVTDKPEELLPTIKSRCQIIGFSPIKNELMYEYIEGNYNILKTDSKIYVNLSKGSLGMLKNMLDSDEVLEIRNRTIDIITKILSGDKAIIFNSEEFFDKNKANIDIILDIILYWFRDLAIYKETEDINFTINQDMESTFRNYGLTDLTRIERIIENVEKTKMNIKGNINFPLSIEMMLLNIGG